MSRRTYPYPMDDNMGRSNPTYVGTETIQTNDPLSVEISEFQKRGLCFDNENYLSEDDSQGAPGNDFKSLNINQSEV